MDDKIVLDKKSFEALAADTRVKILKSLKERRKTLSELSKELKMSVSGTKEHLETLEGAELIVKIDDGHKWKYYELTKKGSDIVGPKELKVMVLLSLSTLALIVSMFAMMAAPSQLAADAAPASQEVPQETAGYRIEVQMEEPEYFAAEPALEAEGNEKSVDDEINTAEPTDGPVPMAANPDEFPAAMLVAAISIVGILASLAILARNRMS